MERHSPRPTTHVGMSESAGPLSLAAMSGAESLEDRIRANLLRQQENFKRQQEVYADIKRNAQAHSPRPLPSPPAPAPAADAGRASGMRRSIGLATNGHAAPGYATATMDEADAATLRAVASEDESVNLLKRQLSRIQQLRTSAQHREEQVHQLQEQVAQLAKYKDDCLGLRSQLAVLDERLKLREAELVRKSQQLTQQSHERAEVERQLRSEVAAARVQGEEARRERDRVAQAKLAELESQLNLLRAGAQQRETAHQQATHELQLSLKHARMAVEAAADRERSLAMSNDTLREQVESGLTELRALQETLEQRNRDVREREEAAAKLARERDVLLRRRAADEAAIDKLQQAVAELRLAAQSAMAEAADVPRLREEVVGLQALRAAVREAEVELKAARTQLEDERSRAAEAKAEALQASALNSELEERVQELAGRLASARAAQQEAEVLRRRFAAQEEETERAHAAAATLGRDLETAQRQRAEREAQLRSAASTIATDVRVILQCVEVAEVAGTRDSRVAAAAASAAAGDPEAGAEAGAAGEGERAASLSAAMRALDALLEDTAALAPQAHASGCEPLPHFEAVHVSIGALRTRVHAALVQLLDARRRAGSTRREARSALAALRQREEEVALLQRSKLEMEQRAADEAAARARVEQEAEEAQATLSSLREDLVAAEERCSQQQAFVARIGAQLWDACAGSDAARPPADAGSDSDAASWLQVQGALADAANACATLATAGPQLRLDAQHAEQRASTADARAEQLVLDAQRREAELRRAHAAELERVQRQVCGRPQRHRRSARAHFDTLAHSLRSASEPLLATATTACGWRMLPTHSCAASVHVRSRSCGRYSWRRSGWRRHKRLPRATRAMHSPPAACSYAPCCRCGYGCRSWCSRSVSYRSSCSWGGACKTRSRIWPAACALTRCCLRASEVLRPQRQPVRRCQVAPTDCTCSAWLRWQYWRQTACSVCSVRTTTMAAQCSWAQAVSGCASPPPPSYRTTMRCPSCWTVPQQTVQGRRTEWSWRWCKSEVAHRPPPALGPALLTTPQSLPKRHVGMPCVCPTCCSTWMCPLCPSGAPCIPATRLCKACCAACAGRPSAPPCAQRKTARRVVSWGARSRAWRSCDAPCWSWRAACVR